MGVTPCCVGWNGAVACILSWRLSRHEKAIREHAPAAGICFDPSRVLRLAQRAVDQVRRDEWNAHERSHTKAGKWIKGTRWSLPKSPGEQTPANSRCRLSRSS